jgi:hypothetical protein
MLVFRKQVLLHSMPLIMVRVRSQAQLRLSAAVMCAGFAPFSIRHLLQFDLLEQLPKLQVVSAAASKEAALAKALSKMQADWQGVEFRVVEYKDTGTYVVGGTDEVQVSLVCSLKWPVLTAAYANSASMLCNERSVSCFHRKRPQQLRSGFADGNNRC